MWGDPRPRRRWVLALGDTRGTGTARTGSGLLPVSRVPRIPDWPPALLQEPRERVHFFPGGGGRRRAVAHRLLGRWLRDLCSRGVHTSAFSLC